MANDAEQLVELAPGDHHELAAGLFQLAQRRIGRVVDAAMMSERAVVIRGEDVEAH